MEQGVGLGRGRTCSHSWRGQPILMLKLQIFSSKEESSRWSWDNGRDRRSGKDAESPGGHRSAAVPCQRRGGGGPDPASLLLS